MPEYLAPGVYVEEVPSGNKPIEGVSTSTVGMVGVTQRGPVNEPTLVTSFPEFLRVYGGYLNHLEFTNHRDKLPYAVEGFFNNGGQRVYISRIVGENATFGAVDLFGTPLEDAVDTALASRVPAGGDSLVVESGANIEAGTILLLVDGPRSEYVTAEGGGTEAGVSVAGALHFDHASGDPVAIQDVTDSTQLEAAGDMSAGDDQLSLADASGLSAGDVVRIRDTTDARLTEFVTISDDASAAFAESGLLFDHALDTTDVGIVTLADAAGEPGGRAVSEDVVAGSATVMLSSTDDLEGAVIRIGTGDTREVHVVGGIVSTVFLATTPLGVRLIGRLHFDHDGDPVAIQQLTEGDNLTATIGGDMTAGGGLQIADASGLSAGDILRLRDTTNPALTEFVTITTDGAADIVEPGLLFDHPQASTELHRVTLAPAAGEPGGRIVQGEASAGGGSVPLNNVTDLQADDVVSLGDGSTREYQIVRNLIEVPPGATTAIANIHTAGTRVVSQVALLRVHARHQGRWGNDLRARIRRTSVLQTQIAASANAGDSPIRLDATFGLSVGSVLEITSGGTAFRQRVTGVSTTTNEVELEAGLATNVQAGDPASSVEFDLTVERLEGGKVVESETIGDLGLDPGHNRYAIATVGRFDTGANRAERAGESELVRLSDLTTGAIERLLTLPFENPIGETELASLYMLTGGNDDLATIDDEEYIGTPAVDPDDRSGIQSLENIDDISIVAVPGQSSQDVQNAIIAHCTRMRYRFGILDSGDRNKLRDVQTQRQNYDTTYGALYYPWMHISDPFGQNGDILSIPPSGHVAGVYARSDNQRGVHKAPANEALLGIRELQFRLTKGEQDILNPRHVNCLRDFREMNRGLRVWGARTLSSDPEFKYINVRRLFLFIEKSIERGSQYAVFEPNSEALWATIYRSVTNFLTAVWRDGALEGTRPEEAFFVKVDRSTMTQNDIDNGRLIILIGIAPVKPAEFVIFRISQKTREAVA